jgi:hypothetical protein
LYVQEKPVNNVKGKTIAKKQMTIDELRKQEMDRLGLKL